MLVSDVPLTVSTISICSPSDSVQHELQCPSRHKTSLQESRIFSYHTHMLISKIPFSSCFKSETILRVLYYTLGRFYYSVDTACSLRRDFFHTHESQHFLLIVDFQSDFPTHSDVFNISVSFCRLLVMLSSQFLFSGHLLQQI